MVFCNSDVLDGDSFINGHNPYFNRWFSAIIKIGDKHDDNNKVTILILIDGFLQ